MASNVGIHHFIAFGLSLLNKAFLSVETLQHGIKFIVHLVQIVCALTLSNKQSSSRISNENSTINMHRKLMFDAILCHVFENVRHDCAFTHNSSIILEMFIVVSMVGGIHASIACNVHL